MSPAVTLGFVLGKGVRFARASQRRCWPARLWRCSLLIATLAIPLTAAPCAAAAAPAAQFSCQPSRAQVASALDLAAADALPAGYPTLSAVPNIPSVLLKAIAWTESSWRQCRAPGVPLTSAGGAFGVMQVTGSLAGPASSTPVQSALANNFVYNVAAGARLLSEKWAATPRAGDGDPTILENWYYAVWAYNEWGWRNNPNNAVYTRHGTPLTDPAAFPYQERVFYLIAHPPHAASGQPLWPAVAEALPDRTQIGKRPAALPASATPHRDAAPDDGPLQLPSADAAQVEQDPAVASTADAAGAAFVAPQAAVTKVWVLRNSGGVFWSGYTWHFVGGEQMDAPITVSVPYVPPLAEVAITASLVAPAQEGMHTGYWQLYDGAGQAVGPRATVALTVALSTPTAAATPSASDTPPLDPTGSLAAGVTPGPIGAGPLDAGPDDAAYVADVTVPDGSVVAPGQHFTKTWEIQNTGAHTWTPTYHWSFEAGAPLGPVRSVASASVAPGGTATFSVEMVAPQRPGTYRGYWQMTDGSGNVFGTQAWVSVHVQTGPTPTATSGVTVPTVLPQPSFAPTPTSTPRPTAVPWFGPAVDRAFFAEGYAGTGYQEYLSLFNPRTHAVHSQLTIYRADGAMLSVAAHLAALERRTLNLNTLAPRASTALKVESDGPVVVERAQYTANGHIVAGASLPSRRWYVAEGYVGSGFRDGLRLFNPGAVPAALTIRAYRGDGSLWLSHRTVSGESRLNVSLDDVAPSGASSLDISSLVPVVIESVVSGRGSAGPSAAMALPGPSRQWYFPDGGTSPGNQEYVALYNPNAARATVRLRVVTSDGYLAPYTLHLRAYSRGVYVVHGLIQRSGLAAALQADRPIVAQEVRYESGGGLSIVDGASAPSRQWGLAEGYAGHGYKEWITLLNPGDRTAVVRIQLLGSHRRRYTVVLHERPRHRDYLYVNDLVPVGQVAAVIAANRPIVAGRTMIFNGGKGLSTTVGVTLSNSG